ncbi:MAG: beta 1-4 rhamnosyltransferase Cps2T [Lachnospira sp.]
MKQVFIVGSKGIPGAYGGYETFVDKLTEYHQNDKDIKYHVACLGTENSSFEYHNARCFKIKAANIGAAQAVFYDVAAIDRCIKYIQDNHVEDPIIYILACRIGPWLAYFKRRIHAIGGVVYINPDGHEWKRAKWNAVIRKYWKISERMMVKNADMVICDSKNIEKYIHDEYGKYNPQTTYIAYGAETRESGLADDDDKFTGWLKEKNLKANDYYLIVGRFVPENNYETMIREFMKSDSKKSLAIITTFNEAFLDALEQRLHFRQDSRIKFVGTVYDQELLKKIRENAYGYFHGHEVGGTNPSLLEALGSTRLNLLLDVGFNREVAEDSAVYWNKNSGNLAKLINEADSYSEEMIADYGRKAKNRIRDAYSWDYICKRYKDVFLNSPDK